jgi:hypothetical protein
MGLPKKIKKDLKLTPEKILLERREELLDYINEDGTYLPKSILHADLDRGFLDFVKNVLRTVVEGKEVPMIDVIITTQNWAQFTETWKFQNMDDNPEPPFITVVRKKETKFGTNPALKYNIPNRKQYFYAAVPTWTGTRKGVDIYTIPQPIPIDINYSIKIVCNRMRELNEFNKNVLREFASRQAYTTVKGHYIPIIMDNISDESVNDLEKRRYYMQNYDFTLLGFLIDEDEFEVKPAVSRSLALIELDSSLPKKSNGKTNERNDYANQMIFNSGVTELIQVYYTQTNISFLQTSNVDSYDVYINNDLYGSDIQKILLNSGDVLRIVITKTNNTEKGIINFQTEIPYSP